MSPDIIAVVLFCVITVFVFMIVLTLSRLIRDPIREQLEAIARNQAGDTDADQIPESQLFVVEGDDLRRDLRRAGFYKPSAVEEFRNTRLLLLFLGVVLTGISVVVIGPEQTDLAM